MMKRFKLNITAKLRQKSKFSRGLPKLILRLACLEQMRFHGDSRTPALRTEQKTPPALSNRRCRFIAYLVWVFNF